MDKYKKRIVYYIDLLTIFSLKEIRARYKMAVLGFLWMVVNPLLQMLVIGFIFPLFLKVEVESYFLFLLSGLLLWNFFSYTVIKTTPMLVFQRNLISKSNFPKESIVLSILISNLLHTLVAYCLLVAGVFGARFFAGNFSVGVLLQGLWGLTLPLLGTTTLTAGLVLILSTINVFFRDVNFLVQGFMPLWFYATPIVYNIKLVPEKIRWFWDFNPMSCYVRISQEVFVNSGGCGGGSFWFSALISLVLFLVGIVINNKYQRVFDDWL